EESLIIHGASSNRNRPEMLESLASCFAFRYSASLNMTLLDGLGPRSQRLHAPFTGPNTHRIFHLSHKDFAIADFSVLGLFQNCLNCALGAIVSDHNLEFYFGKEIHRVLGAAINLAVSLLAAKSFHLAQSHSFNACRH